MAKEASRGGEVDRSELTDIGDPCSSDTPYQSSSVGNK